MSALKIYGDMGSQPTRAVVALCKLNNIPYKFMNVQIFKQEQRSAEFAKINPLKYIPAIVDEPENNFTLFESHAILRYICRTKKVSDQWYPIKDPITQANIDKYLDWHHLNLRLNASGYFKNKFVLPLIGVKPQHESTIQEYLKNLKFTLKTIDQVFLKNNKWVAGTSEMTIADLSCACELIQLLFLKDYDFNEYPNIQSYLKRFFENKTIQEVHKPFFKGLTQLNPSGAEKFQQIAKL